MPEARKLHVAVRLEDESFWATVAEFPGVFATGDTLDELRESLEEGIALMVAGPDDPLPAVRLGKFQPWTPMPVAHPVETIAELVCA